MRTLTLFLFVIFVSTGTLVAIESEVSKGGADQKTESSPSQTETKDLKEKEKNPSTDQKKTEKDKKSKKKKEEEEEDPWFDGTFLALYGKNVEPGRYLVTPSVILSHLYGDYNAHGSLSRDRDDFVTSLLLSFETGITKTIDFTIDIQWNTIQSPEGSFSAFSDTHLQWGFQISTDKKGKWIPNLRVILDESFPTGKFDNLDLEGDLIDVTGQGGFATGLLFVAEKTFCNSSCHPYKWNLNLGLFIRNQVKTEGLSLYGGGPGVRGLADPGIRFFANLSYEYKFDKNWGWGMDLHYEYLGNSSFSTLSGTPLFAGNPVTANLSLAPEIEYNFNADFAVEAGFWYTFAGWNTVAFFNGFLSLSYLF